MSPTFRALKNPNYRLWASGALVSLKTREALPAIALLLTAPERPAQAPALHDLVEQIGGALGQARSIEC